MRYSRVPSEAIVVAVDHSWVLLSPLLPERYRVAFALGLLVVGFGGLLVLAYKIRTAEPETGDREITSNLERADLLEGGTPQNTLEWVIQVSNRWQTYAAGIASLLVLAALGMYLESSVAMLALFGGALLSLQAFLRFGWRYVERFYERRQPEERNPHSLRFQGFSTDVNIFLTFLVATFVVVMVLIGIEMTVR